MRNIGRVCLRLRFCVLCWCGSARVPILYQLNIVSDYAITQYRTNASEITHLVRIVCSGLYPWRRWIQKVARGPGADPRGVTWVMTPPLRPGAPQACQGHRRLSRGTTGLAEAPQNFQGTPRDHMLVRCTTGLPGAPQAFEKS